MVVIMPGERHARSARPHPPVDSIKTVDQSDTSGRRDAGEAYHAQTASIWMLPSIAHEAQQGVEICDSMADATQSTSSR